ncbi:MAG: polysaccharide biosynthesis tyrosine autokinase [Bacteroidales bacterium]|nr:polysaccharide biosynthesis tyrosine autokinase [Bacteroidales bacterium]
MRTGEEEFQQHINYKKIVQRFLGYKRFYIFTIVIFLIGAFLYNKSATVLYQNQTTVMISEKEKSAFSGGKDFMQGMAFLSGQINIDNEVEILSSFSIVKEAIQRMDLKVSIYTYEMSFYSDLLERTNFVKKKEQYEHSPIKVIVDPTHDQAVYLPFYIEFIDDNSFKIYTKSQKDDVYLYNYIDDVVTDKKPYKLFNYKYNFGQEIKTEYCSFLVLKTPDYDKNLTNDNVLYFYLNNTNLQTFEYQSYLSVEPISQTASIIRLTLKGTNYYRVSDYLNELSSVFLNRNLQKKNNAAASTVSFIDAQISEFKDSLSTAEASLKSFRTSHQVMDLSFQGQQVFSKLSELEKERQTLKDQQRYYLYLKDYFNKNRDISDLIAPSSMNVVDPILTNLVSELITINSERVSHTGTSSDNILLRNYNIRIENLKNTISENVDNSLKTLNASVNEIDYRINKLSNQISTMPKTELQLKGIERKFELNSAIYTFLLQKRSEAQITKASSMPDYEVVEPARAITPHPVAPRTKLNYAIALFLGLLVPTSYVFVLDFFNNRLNTIEEIEAMSDKPVLGKVFHSFRKTTLVVAQRPNSSVSESFRGIRTNFQFFDHGGKKQVVLFTSSASGDGKTFCSINFASVLALNGYKTALLEFDLRRPKVHQEFGSSNMIGISSFLIDKAVIDDIILPTEIENLDLISAGPAAPNPAELIGSERTSEFIETLKEMYDYIIIDSAPVGIVSETYLLMKHSDVNIFVVRLDYTVREAFRNALKGLKNNSFENFNILINDLNIRKESFKYGYDNKYYTDEPRNFFGRLLRRRG